MCINRSQKLHVCEQILRLCVLTVNRYCVCVNKPHTVNRYCVCAGGGVAGGLEFEAGSTQVAEVRGWGCEGERVRGCEGARVRVRVCEGERVRG